MKLALFGDVSVRNCTREKFVNKDADGLFRDVATIMRSADLTFVNVECAITESEGEIKKFGPCLKSPMELAEDGDFDAEEYSREMKNAIHPSFYSFDSHAVRYAVATVWDDCGEPGKTKDSVAGSLVIRLKCQTNSRIRCEVGTDGSYSYLGEFGCGRLGFGELDFSGLSLSGERYMNLPIRESRRGWMEKSVSVWSEDYCRPFGIARISFDYTVKGRPKRK